MLDVFYGTCRPLPGDRKALYRLLRAESQAERSAISRVIERFWRTLPAELEPLYELLNLRSEADRKPLRMVVTEWTEVGGLINIRALGEIVKARVIAEKNKQIAIEREQRKRQEARSGGGRDARH
jgi:uncharacterized protein YdaU (DUF1376 family)